MVNSPHETLLVVDDDESSRKLARQILEDEGHRVVVAADGVEALAAFEREKPGCVLLDVRMRGMDGFEVCKRIRSLPGGTDTPVIFLTAMRELETFDASLRAGGDDFVTKPFRPAELVIRVQVALKLRSAQAECLQLLKSQRADLLRLNFLKERQAAFLVHDLKTPIGTTERLVERLLGDRTLTDKVQALLIRIRACAQQLDRMVLNLLDLSRADEGKLCPHLDPIDPLALVCRVFSELEVVAQVRSVRLQSSISAPSIRADEELLRRSIANLVENAIRHSPPQAAVTVSVESSGHSSEICVADAGSGVPAELKEKIFDPFVQAEGVNSSRTCRGLGLAFCKMVAEAHGGTIAVRDAFPGAIFCVTVPAHAC